MEDSALVTFFALWPSPDLQTTLGGLAEELAAGTGGRAIRTPRIHLTLVYIGATPKDRVNDLTEMAQRVTLEPFTLVLDRLGGWKRKGIAWLGASEVPQPLLRLQEALRTGTAALGFPVESRPYVPHITLVREARGGLDIGATVDIAWQVRAFELVRSEFNPARYTVLQSCQLGER